MCQSLRAQEAPSHAPSRQNCRIPLESTHGLNDEPDDSVAQAIELVPELPGQEKSRVDQEMQKSVYETRKHADI